MGQSSSELGIVGNRTGDRIDRTAVTNTSPTRKKFIFIARACRARVQAISLHRLECRRLSFSTAASRSWMPSENYVARNLPAAGFEANFRSRQLSNVCKWLTERDSRCPEGIGSRKFRVVFRDRTGYCDQQPLALTPDFIAFPAQRTGRSHCIGKARFGLLTASSFLLGFLRC